MRLSVLFAIVTAIALPLAASPKKEKKDDGNEKQEQNDKHVYVTVVLDDGSRTEGELTKGWFRWPAKTINENFKVRLADGQEVEYTSQEVDSILIPASGRRLTTAYIPVPKLFNKNNMVKWIVACGPKSEHGEILTYMSRALVKYGNKERWVDCYTRCMRFDNDSTIYPFDYSQNGGINLSLMKKFLKETRPEAVDFIDRYFKADKKLKKELSDRPELFLAAYEEYLRTQKP